MRVNDRTHVRPRLVDGGMDEALLIALPLVAHRTSFQVVLDEIARSDERRREVARQQKVVRILIVADADMAETVQDTLIGENAIANDEIVDELRAGSARASLTRDALRHEQAGNGSQHNGRPDNPKGHLSPPVRAATPWASTLTARGCRCVDPEWP